MAGLSAFTGTAWAYRQHCSQCCWALPMSRTRLATTPCASLILRHHQTGQRTSTSKLSIMLSTHRKTASRRPLRNPIRCFDQAAARAAEFFRFLRQPSRPNAPRPVAKRGRAAGSGVAVTLTLSNPMYERLAEYPIRVMVVEVLAAMNANVSSCQLFVPDKVLVNVPDVGPALAVAVIASGVP